MRAAIVAGGALVALLFLLAGGVFGVNGPNWDWWRALALVEAVVVLLLTVWAALALPGPRRRNPRAAAPFLVAAVGCAIANGRWFNDSYDGSRAWPDALAVAAFVTMTAAVSLVAAATADRS